jgi:hypothetical protein
MLQKAISSHHVQPTTVQEQKHAIEEKWAQIPHHKVRRRYQAVINARGHHTRY